MSLIGIVAVAVVLAIAQTVVFRSLGLKSIRYKRYFTESAVYEGQHVQMVEELSNAKLLPLPWLKVEARMSKYLQFKRQADLAIADDTYHRSLFALGPWRKITRTHNVTCIRRGCYNIESVAVSCGDLLGFGERTITLQNPMELVVYPKILDYGVLNVPSRRWQGDVIVHRFIEPDLFLINGIRPFINGDMLKDVHWAATARTGTLKVKTRDYTASPRLLLVVNIQLFEDQWGELNEEETLKIEECLSLAATYAEWAFKNGVETGFICNGRLAALNDREVEVPMGAGSVHLTAMLETMARVRIIRRRGFAQYLDDEVIPRGISGTDILILSQYWSPRLEERAGRLRRMENSVTWICPGEARNHA